MFTYYITNCFDGTVEGTDDPRIAHNRCDCEEFFVVQPGTNEWILPGGERRKVEAIKPGTVD